MMFCCLCAAGFATIGGLVNRVGDLAEKLHAVEQDLAQRRLRQASTIRLDNVSAHTPNGQRALFSHLSFEIAPDSFASPSAIPDLLICGPSGCGKTALLRVIAGLWDADPQHNSTGVSRPLQSGRGGVFFVPQNPYTTQGSLREQIIYPHLASEQTCTDAKLSEILSLVDLGFLLKERVCSCFNLLV